MKLFKDSRGIILAFGFNVAGQEEAPERIYWSDQKGKWDWHKHGSGAGFIDMQRRIDPEFIRECNGQIITYQPGLCIQMTYVGPPMTWTVQLLAPA